MAGNINNSNTKQLISDVNDSIKKLPERCPCCFEKADFTDTIDGCETNA